MREILQESKCGNAKEEMRALEGVGVVFRGCAPLPVEDTVVLISGSKEWFEDRVASILENPHGC